MATYGYIFITSQNGTMAMEDKARMQELGCDRIIEESSQQEKLRPEWRRMLSNLKKDDTIILSKLSYSLRGIRELGAFLDLCSRYRIRIISLQDHFDTEEKIFPNPALSDVFNTIGTLSSEVIDIRQKEIKALRKVRSVKNPRSLKTELKLDREKTVVNMYNSGHSISDIWAASGYKSRTSVFRVLNRYGVQLNREKLHNK